ncbi:hypothetical protein M9980_02175 [Sphingomonas donggukensis]|uniref:Uncharacterized protein n=1 Tax=Sphingomonas donggukensis TaxID=2949093 RepID=A0ABY4TUJ5_9SPHN|nr:hypothetical protein [Sphingomonas donggukensis]URW76061.1 hypothetical protein M9980_02175 [Sphingomonas donggukensis]
MDKRRTAIVVAAALALIALTPHPTADIRIETHDIADVAPRRFQAAVDLGVMAVKVLVTWSAEVATR